MSNIKEKQLDLASPAFERIGSLVKNGIPTLTQPSYSPALAVCVTSGPF